VKTARSSRKSRAEPAFYAAACLLALLGLALRIPGLFTDLWLDELWSLANADAVRSPLEVFTSVHSDNNHYLYTLYLLAIGDNLSPGPAAWAVYRIPSLLAGVGSVLVAGMLGRRRSAAEAILAMALTATSFALAMYSSEVRGYSLLVFFALLSFWFLVRYSETGRRSFRVGYWASTILGFLSQLVYLFFFMGAVSWAYWLRWSERRGGTAAPENAGTAELESGRTTELGRGTRLVRLHDVPLLFLGVLFVVDLRHMTLGGGPPFSSLSVTLDVLSLALGGPESGVLRLVAALASAALILVGLRRLRKSGDTLWVLYGVAMVAFPAFLLVVARPPFFFPRYFLIPIALFQLLLAFLLAHVWHDGGRAGRAAVLGALLLIAIGNAGGFAEFWALGRGHYREAVFMMASEESARPATVGSDHDFRNRMLVDYYVRLLPVGRELRYADRDKRPPGGWDWWIRHTLEPGGEPRPRLRDAEGTEYRIVKSFPSSRLSGFTWHVYRKGPGPHPDRPE